MFLNQASKGNNDFILYLIVLVSLPFGYFIGYLPLDLTLRWASNKYEDILPSTVDEFYNGNLDFSLFHLHSNIGLLLMITIFVGVLIVLVIGVKFLHKRTITSLITAKDHIDVKKIIFAFAIWLGMSLISESVLYLLNPEIYTFSFSGSSFFVLILIGLFILPIQTTAEELVFRGYLMQGIFSHFKAPWLALLITSILFGFVHAQNPEVSEYGALPMQAFYISAGLFLGLITIFDNSLELAIGVHASVNFFGAVISTYEGSVLQMETLIKSSYINPWVILVIFYIQAVIFMLICAKKYNWAPINTLFKKLDKVNFDEA